MGLLQGLLGNYSQMSPEEIQSEFSGYLIEGEEVQFGFKLVRDVLIFTNLRIIDMDKQGMTGKKVRITSIYLDAICEVTCETAGAGLDDSEITLTYIKSPYRRVNNILLESKKFEFPKKFDVVDLYAQLEAIAHDNVMQLNS
jgi:hypothetical protein